MANRIVTLAEIRKQAKQWENEFLEMQDSDPTPGQLLEWMKEQLELYADCRASGNWNNLPLHFIPCIIDTVKRVTG